MKAIKKLLDTKTKKIIAIALVLIFLGLGVWIWIDQPTGLKALEIVLWTLLFVAAVWLAIHFGTKAWRKRKRKDFDQQVAAKEGIEDRRREWANWTDELEKQGIDRYELPFYLLVGEPQSGKSVLLHNSDLHFPFGQSRLSGVGGTRGCDWWFTEEAVILDLAGRLFTHEGGAADRLEFEAFLELLYEFRPLCPVNGVMLVIPCDSLLKDTPEVCAAKATKIQAALHTLTTKLQAQIPVYLVLTKGDQVFGFAESVHRLDVDRRHQMFGWSRPSERSEAPFDLEEVHRGFLATVERARLLRAHMLAGARLPEALPEVDRMYAFAPELEGLYPNLEVYLKRIFTSSNVVDRVFFRGLYLTSGLQTGVPIAKVCSELFGQAGEADARDLEALFSKQRAYFIKDLIRERIFGERGLVRPTQGRVQQARRVARVGYGLSAALVLASALFGAHYLRGVRALAEVSGTGEGKAYIAPEDRAAIEAVERVVQNENANLRDVLGALGVTAVAVRRERGAYEELGQTTRETLRNLYCKLFDKHVIPQVRREAQANLAALLERGPSSHAELQRLVNGAEVLSAAVDFAAARPRAIVLECLPEYAAGEGPEAGLNLARSFELREDYGDDDGMTSPPPSAQDGVAAARLLSEAARAFERCLEPGSATQPEGEVGFVLAWKGAEEARDALLDSGLLRNAGPQVFATCATYKLCVAKLEELQPRLSGKLAFGQLLNQMIQLASQQARLQTLTASLQGAQAGSKVWQSHLLLKNFAWDRLGDRAKMPVQVTDWWSNPVPGDFGQDFWAILGGFTSQVGGDVELQGDYDPLKKFGVEAGDLLTLCEHSLRPDPQLLRLRGLSARLAALDQKVDGDFRTDCIPVFLAQCVAAAQWFDDLETPDDLRAVYGDPEPGEAAGLFWPGLAVELASLHSAVGTVRERELDEREEGRMRAWQGRIEGLLHGYLESLRQGGEAQAWVAALAPGGAISDEGWSQLEALGRVAALVQVDERFPLVATARQLQLEAFLVSGQELLERWQSRELLLRPQDPKTFLRDTVQSATELRQLASGVFTRLKGQTALSGPAFDNWRRKVDELFDSRLGSVETAVRSVWQVDPAADAGLLDVVDLAERELEPQQIQKRIETSAARDLARVAELLRLTPSRSVEWGWLKLENSTVRAGALEPWKTPASVSDVLDSRELTELGRVIQGLRGVGPDQGPELAAEFARHFARGQSAEAAPNAGVGLARRMHEELRKHLLAEVRARYLQALTDLLGEGRFEALRQVLSWKPGERGTFDQDDNVVGQLDLLLKERGVLDTLRREFRLVGFEPSLEALLFDPAESGAACEPAPTLHHFLASLQKFLLEDGSQRHKSVRDTKLRFHLHPTTDEHPNSVWFAPREEFRDYFYYPGNRSSNALQVWPVVRERKKLTVDQWGFEGSYPRRQLTLLWSKFGREERAGTDDTGYRYEVPSSLAPLLLAWQGRASEDCKSFNLELKPSKTTRTALLRLEFESAAPQPPESWPW